MKHIGHYLWLMLLCCLIPVAALSAIFIFGIPANSVVLMGLALLCPLLHLGMMLLGGHEYGGLTRGDTSSDQRETRVITGLPSLLLSETL